MLKRLSLRLAGLKPSRTLSKAAAASRLANCGFVRSSTIADDKELLSAGETRMADSPSLTSSGTPPTLVATMGTRAAILSRRTLGEPSDNEGNTNKSAIENKLWTSERW